MDYPGRSIKKGEKNTDIVKTNAINPEFIEYI